MWRLTQGLGGQLRGMAGPGGIVVTGFDMTAALSMAAALGIDPRAVATLLPAVEAGMVAGIAKRRDPQDG